METTCFTGIQPVAFAGHRCLQFFTQHGTAIVAMHGAQLLSWHPNGQREIFWMSPTTLAPPAAIRGGVPICWPWFGTQGMPTSAMAHGPVRNRLWEVQNVDADDPERIRVTWVPRTGGPADDPLQQLAPGLQVSLHMEIGDTVVQTLRTRNNGTHDFALTQAFHNYFAVHDATQVPVIGLAGLRYDDKLHAAPMPAPVHVQRGEFVLEQACDRIFQSASAQAVHRYTLQDRAWRRCIHVTTEGSQSVVVWNPGPNQARRMADLPEGEWRNFLCVETANAGSDVVVLAPGEQHSLRQTLAWEPMAQS